MAWFLLQSLQSAKIKHYLAYNIYLLFTMSEFEGYKEFLPLLDFKFLNLNITELFKIFKYSIFRNSKVFDFLTIIILLFRKVIEIILIIIYDLMTRIRVICVLYIIVLSFKSITHSLSNKFSIPTPLNVSRKFRVFFRALWYY